MSLPGSYLEEVYLHGAVAEVQDDGALGSEPVAEVGEPSQLVTVTPRHVSPRLQQALTHVVTEIFQQGDLEEEVCREQKNGGRREIKRWDERVKK